MKDRTKSKVLTSRLSPGGGGVGLIAMTEN